MRRWVWTGALGLAVLALLSTEQGAAHFGVPFNEPDKWYLRSFEPFPFYCEGDRLDPVNLVFYNGATTERTSAELVHHLPYFDTTHSGAVKCMYDHGQWEVADFDRKSDRDQDGYWKHIRSREGADSDDALFDTYSLGAAHRDQDVSTILCPEWHVSVRYNQTRDEIWAATTGTEAGHSGWKGWVGNTDEVVQTYWTGLCQFTAQPSDGYVAFSDLGRLDLTAMMIYGPAPVKISDSIGRYAWMIGRAENPGVNNQNAEISLSVTGKPSGCSQVQTLMIPGYEQFSLPALQYKWVLYRLRYECHTPAQRGVYTLSSKLCIREASHDFDYECVTTTRSLIVD